ncbi:MAG: hypothetical protein AB7E47_13875 [Desulfovibrionaceae bacterium]
MNFWIILGGVGAVASIAGVFLPAQSRHPKLIHIVYGIAVVAMTTVAVSYWQETQRVRSVERAASALIKNVSFDYSNAGFVQAALAFLEKNKDLYPDSYARAQKMADDCKDSKDPFQIGSLASALKGLFKGISAIESGS